MLCNDKNIRLPIMINLYDKKRDLYDNLVFFHTKNNFIIID